MDDSKKYDLSEGELQELLLGLLTAIDIDPALSEKYWADTFPGSPHFPIEDIPSVVRLHVLLIGWLSGVLVELRHVPDAAPFVEALFDSLRAGNAWPRLES